MLPLLHVDLGHPMDVDPVKSSLLWKGFGFLKKKLNGSNFLLENKNIVHQEKHCFIDETDLPHTMARQ